MDNKTMTPEEAWRDFWVWVKQQPEWANKSRKDRQYLDKTNRAVISGTAGAERINNALQSHAPGRYVCRVVFEVVA